MKLYLYIVGILFTLTCCNKATCRYAIIGGEIINKNTNYVILFDSKTVIDTVNLDGNNRFVYKLNDLNPGVYTFQHGEEIQMVLLEPGDSIMFRLNTFDFDESLVYTGKGAKKNNYLINDFLQNEIEKKEIYKYCQLTPYTFENRIDSIRNLKNEQLKLFKNKHNPSELFNKIAQANINYSYYTSKEIYPFVRYGQNKKEILNGLPKDFYDFRKNVNYNDDVFKNYYNYKIFLRHSFNNIALQQHLKNNDSKGFNWMDLCYNTDKLKVIDSMISVPKIKEDLLFHYTMGFLSKNKKLDNNQKIIDVYLKKSTDIKKRDIVLSYNKSINRLRPGKPFPDIHIVNIADDVININTLFTKPTVIYFWSHVHKRYFEESHKRIDELSSKYPEVRFISVNIDDYSTETWIKTLRNKKLSLDNEYIFENPKQSKEKLAIYPLTKVILVRDGGTIVNGNANMFRNNFEEEILGLLNL